MSSSFALPSPLQPRRGETLASLIMRNAERYRFDNPMRLLTRAGVRVDSLHALMQQRPPPSTEESLAILLGIEPARLREMAAWEVTPGLSCVGGVEILPRFLDFENRRACPACLRDDGYHHGWWDVRALTICPHHGRELLNHCPGCGNQLRWFGQSLMWCGNRHCRFDLRGTPTGVPPLEVSHTAGLLQLLNADDTRVLPGCNLAFGHAVEVAYFLGRALDGRGLLGRTDHYLRSQTSDVARIMETGWNALVEWPTGFHRALDQLRSQSADKRGRYGLRKEFGSLSKWLATISGLSWAKPLLAAFAEYLASQSDLRTSAAALRRFGSPEALRSRHMTLNDAADFLGVAGETMISLAEREDLFLVERSGAGAPTLLRADRVHELRTRKEGALLKQEAEKILGIGRKALKDLLDHGLLAQVSSDARVTQQRLIDRAATLGLITNMRGKLQPRASDAPLQRLSWSVSGRRTITDVCVAVLDGKISPRGINSTVPGIGGLLFDGSEIEAAFLSQRATMSVVEACKVLGVDVESVRVWISSGLLSTERRTARNEKGRRLTVDGLDDFRRRFVTANEISTTVGTTGRWTWERLRFLGHESITPSAMTKLYDRDILTPELLARLRPSKPQPDRAGAASAAADLAKRVGDEVGIILGKKLLRYWNGFFDEETSTHVQVIVGRRPRFKAQYVFRFNPAMRVRLDAANHGWLALALSDIDVFLLLPWAKAREMVGDDDQHRHHIYVPVDAKARVTSERLAPYRHELPQ